MLVILVAIRTCLKIVMVMTVVVRVKDMGAIIDSQIILTHHIDQIVARAFTHANLIDTCFVSRDTASLTHAFIILCLMSELSCQLEAVVIPSEDDCRVGWS